MSGKSFYPVKKTQPCRFGPHCRFGTKCTYLHTEEEKQTFAAIQAEKYRNMRACHNGSRCTNEGCTHGHNEDVIRAANKDLGFIHEIEPRVAEFYKIEANLAEIDEMIAKQEAEEAEQAEEDAENAEYLNVAAAWYAEQEALRIVEEAFAGVEVGSTTNAAALSCYGPPAGRSDNTPTCSGILTNAAAVSPKKTYAQMATEKVPPAPKKGLKPFNQPMRGFDEKGNRVLFPMPDGNWGDLAE